MSRMCMNKACDYWTRTTVGTCAAVEFCGGFIDKDDAPAEKRTEKRSNRNGVFFDDEFMSTEELAGCSSNDITRRM